MKPVRSAFAFALAAALPACQPPSPDASETRNVFGTDDRREVTSPQYPLSSIGRVDSGCTGALVGKRLVMTAAHCVVDSAGAIKPMAFTFRADFQAGQAQKTMDVKRVWYGTKTPEETRERDWAILELTEPFGDGRRPLPVDAEALTDTTTFPRKAALAGFQIDRGSGRTLLVDDDCEVRKRDGVRFLHDCDSTSGISGAPLLDSISDTAHVIGVQVSEYRQGADASVRRNAYSDDYANVAISASAFAPTLARLAETVDQGLDAPEIEGVFSATNPSPRSRPKPLADYTWTFIGGVQLPVANGLNGFDVAFPNSVQGNPFKVEITPDSCTRIGGIQLSAIVQPETDDWVPADMFETWGALFRTNDIKFLRLRWIHRGFAQVACNVGFYAALGSQGPTGDDGGTTITTTPSARMWYCQAAPFDAPQVYAPFYWYGPSLDGSRFQALTLCAQAYGNVCTVRCQPAR